MDHDLERAIDRVGRDRVFSYAKALGWSAGNALDKFVWWQIVRELEASDKEPLEINEQVIDEAVTRIYLRFKDWSKRNFSADDVTWCEVRADVVSICEELILASKR